MHFVPVETVKQEAILSVHRARQGFIRARTATANPIEGVLAENASVLLRGIRKLQECKQLVGQIKRAAAY